MVVFGYLREYEDLQVHQTIQIVLRDVTVDSKKLQIAVESTV